jgi:hypothetical protein
VRNWAIAHISEVDAYYKIFFQIRAANRTRGARRRAAPVTRAW